MHLNINNSRIELIRGDITDQEVDAIVNAANASLAGGGGVDGAIHRRGGSAIMRETDERYPNGCPTGSAVASGAGNLKVKFVFHAVGPRWKGGMANEPALLQSAYRTCLELAVKHDCRSIAFPSISTGVYGYPIQQAAPLAIQTVTDFLRNNPEPLHLVRFCLFSDADLAVYSKALTEAKPD
jgi:O-acetyl-ADP-ribose deacetylase (regulator of RNase III)